MVVYTFRHKKFCLKEILRLYNVGVKWVKWKCGYKYGVYVYIRSMGRDRLRVKNIYLFFTSTTPHRWTAIGMGADRYQTAIGALSNDSVPRLT